MTRQHGAVPQFAGLLGGLLILAAGCAHDRAAGPATAANTRQAHWLTHVLPVVPRGEIKPDLTLVAHHVPPPTTAIPDGTIYHELAANEAQCLAVRNSTVGNLLANERRAAGVSSGCACRGSERADSLRLHLLSFAEMEARNDSALAALELYYRLALSENQVDAATQSLNEVHQTRKATADLIQRGIRPPAETGVLDRQTLELAQQRLDATIGRSQANWALRSLIGVETCEPDWRIWPNTSLTVDPSPLDVQAAVLVALNERPELGLLRLLECELDVETLPVARGVLSRANGLIGFQAPPGCCFVLASLKCYLDKFQNDPCEAELRRRQLNQYRARREAEIASEVQQHAATAEQRLQQVLYARDRAASSASHVGQLVEQQKTGGATYAEVAEARLQAIKARNELVSRVVDWHLAMVRFRHSQGTLSAECGYHATMRCWVVPPNELLPTAPANVPQPTPATAAGTTPGAVPRPT
ncbi:MAG: hypothetical protein K1X74_19870 [Pirellulales bacterium]|nr:hypothetical protein [Pirellulales bacterium]